MPETGQRVGEYLLEQKIGSGAFGEVWRARHHVWADQKVAIKIPIDPQYLKSLQREGVVIHGLIHPNIVKAVGFDPFAPTPYLAMEYIPGSSLRPPIADRSLSVPDSVSILKQVLAGLQYAHDNGLVHRDIKPENILVHERAATDGYGSAGVVKVTDFGLGKASNVAANSIVLSQSINDAVGREIAGTLDYMAPEQRSGQEIDGRADLYAVGVVLYEMLTGERPAGLEAPSDLNKTVPKALDDVFRKAYSRKDKRFASATEFSEALAAATLGQSPLGGKPPALPVGDRRVCPQCRGGIEPSDQFCMHCGVQLVPVVRRCLKCGAFPDMDDQFCIFCGRDLTADHAAV